MLAVKAHPFISYFSDKREQIIAPERRYRHVLITHEPFNRKCFSHKMEFGAHQLLERNTTKFLLAVQAVSSGVQDSDVLSSFKDFTITASSADKDKELKITVEVSGTKTQEIFDEVFSRMVEDAQPIPGFRRVKGGKTPNIPKDILLEILGPFKVHEQVIKKIINSTIAEYVSKEGLRVGKDLHVEQSFEDLEAGFAAGDKFRFDAVLQRRESD